ncbi:uncharacterized protein [Marmota flaviventris]|uniref:uncharacterized protein n=1 Tax=Marmota flaviventris TaxID=93162 RepID=UPI003A880EEE
MNLLVKLTMGMPKETTPSSPLPAIGTPPLRTGSVRTPHHLVVTFNPRSLRTTPPPPASPLGKQLPCAARSGGITLLRKESGVRLFAPSQGCASRVWSPRGPRVTLGVAQQRGGPPWRLLAGASPWCHGRHDGATTGTPSRLAKPRFCENMDYICFVHNAQYLHSMDLNDDLGNFQFPIKMPSPVSSLSLLFLSIKAHCERQPRKSMAAMESRGFGDRTQ